MKHFTFLLILAGTLVGGSLRAQVPNLINYQGRVMVGNINFDGSGQFKFALVNAAGTTTYWSNNGTSVGGSEPSAAVPLTVIKGLYSVLLGDTSLPAMTALPASAFGQADLRLRVWFNDGTNGSQRLSPDQRLAPTAYLAANSVTTASIADAAINGPKIAVGAVSGTQVATNTLDASRFAVVGPPNAGQVLGFNGTGLTWTAPGGGVFSLNGTNAYYNGGNVGIGTNAPATPLEVRTATGVNGLSQSDGTRRVGTYVGGGSGGDGGWLGTISNHPLYLFVNNGAPQLTVVNGGVGIGTPSPSSKLHLYDSANSVTEMIETAGGTNSWSLLALRNGSGQWNIGTSRDFNGNQLYFYRSGSVANQFEIQPSGDAVLRGSLVMQTATGVAGFKHTDGTITVGSYIGGSASGASGGWLGTFSNHPLHFFVNNGQPSMTIGTDGITSVKTLRITGGADLAEPFQMEQEEPEKGSVVVIDAEHPGRLKSSNRAYDTRVAGIVSGANGIKPGIALQQNGAVEGGQNVALSGRVYVKADSSSGPIRPGDLLTTSDIPGHAMKVTNHARSQGAVIGKAMSSLDESEGMVLVLVTLQ